MHHKLQHIVPVAPASDHTENCGHSQEQNGTVAKKAFLIDGIFNLLVCYGILFLHFYQPPFYELRQICL
jgi:hypothetical protein